jgi:hypothetical protein
MDWYATTHAPGYGPLATATSWKAGRFSGKDFALQPDGTLCCPAGKTLHPTEQRIEHDGSLRVLYAARIGDCRICPLREQCQWHGHQTTKPRRVSLLLHPLSVGSAPLLWHDWSRRVHRRACMHLLRRQRVDVTFEQALSAHPDASPPILSRAQRAHYRLSLAERVARNARPPSGRGLLARREAALLGKVFLSERLFMPSSPGCPSNSLLCCSFAASLDFPTSNFPLCELFTSSLRV